MNHAMMLAAAVHPAITIPAGALLVAIIAWYWKRLGAPEVPETRRRLRRASIAVMVVFIFVLVGALSFVNHRTNQSQFVVIWSIAISLLLIVVFIAFMDVVNNLRIHRRAAADAAAAARIRLTEAALEARRRRTESAPSGRSTEQHG